MKWFRFYHDVINDPKILRLDERTQLAWVRLLCLASAQAEDVRGTLPESVETIARALGVEPEQAQATLKRLIVARLIDVAKDGTMVMHNWEKWQYNNDGKLATGWNSYQEYLRSEHWLGTRDARLSAAYYRCQVCNAGKCELHVHHRTYERLGAERPDDLIVLCQPCHDLFHRESKLTKGGMS